MRSWILAMVLVAGSGTVWGEDSPKKAVEFGWGPFPLVTLGSHLAPQNEIGRTAPWQGALELGLGVLFSPNRSNSWVLGPRLAYWGALGGNRPSEWLVGGTSTLWIMNAIGSGLDLDWMARSKQVRVSPFLGIRILRLLDFGALALRGGPFYETRAGWGWSLGLSLQWDGVPRLF